MKICRDPYKPGCYHTDKGLFPFCPGFQDFTFNDCRTCLWYQSYMESYEPEIITSMYEPPYITSEEL